MKIKNSILWTTVCLALVIVLGCDKDEGPGTDTTADEDVAASIASAMSDEGGGVADQFGDAADLASPGGIQSQANGGGILGIEGAATVDTVYDNATKTWTVTINRNRTTPGGMYAASIYRKYTYQFKNKNGVAQKYYVVAPDTAYTISFKIIEGNGYRKARYMTHRLDSLSGDWTITNANTPTITINGTYYRRGSDTLTTRNATRTLNHALALTFTNCTAVRGNRSNISQTMSGTVSGTYDATISVTRGELYNERSISRTFTVTFSGGSGTILMRGLSFPLGMRYGELSIF